MTRDPNTPRQKPRSKYDPRQRRAIVMRFAIFVVILMVSSLVFTSFARRATQDIKTPEEIENTPLKADAESVDDTEF